MGQTCCAAYNSDQTYTLEPESQGSVKFRLAQLPPSFLENLNSSVKRKPGEIPMVVEGSDECNAMLERFDSGWNSFPSDMEEEFLTQIRIGALESKAKAMAGYK